MYKHAKSLVQLASFVLTIALITIILFPFQTVVAQQPSTPPGPTDRAELEAFFDQAMAGQLHDFHVPGAMVVVVQNGETLFAKGYGYADLERQTPVVTDRTLFRIGSVTKLFTATAVMQLVEQGKLDLDADVNTYLKDFQIPATYPQPVTLTHLLTHTAGFDDRYFGFVARTPAELLPLGQWLALNIPTRVRPPGQLSAYSNYGMALAGYIVASVAGVPYEQYIEEHILKPLEMQHTTARQPLPPEFASDIAASYTYANDKYVPQPFELYQTGPAGSITSNATDMAHFMIAHLQNGRYLDNRILQETTAQRMHSTLFRHDPRLNGYAYGFEENSTNNQRVLGHGGKNFGFSTLLKLLPDQNLGFFVSYNSTTGTMAAREQLFQAFMDHYYPVPPTSAEPPADFPAQASRFTGSYQLTTTTYSTIDKITGLVNPIHIQATSDGYLTLNGSRFVQIEPLVFREVSRQNLLIFQEDKQGNIIYAFYDGDPTTAFVKLPWYEDPDLHMILLAASLLVLISGVIVSLASWIVHHLRKSNEAQPGLGRLARWTAVITAVLNILFLVAIMAIVGDPSTYFFVGDVFLLLLVLTPPMISAVFTVGMLVMTVLIWRNRTWRLPGRIHYTLVTLAAVVFIIILNYWNLLGWKLGGS